MILFCTASDAEQKYILDFDNVKKAIIGSGNLNILFGIEYHLKSMLESVNLVVLFGSAGLMNFNLKTDCLYMPEKFWYLIDYKYYMPDELFMKQVNGYAERIQEGLTEPIRITKRKKFRKQHEKFNIVDRESAHVIKRCHEVGVPVIVIRYISDKCDKKLMPMGINHFHRKYHEWKMQQRMNLILKDLSHKFKGE